MSLLQYPFIRVAFGFILGIIAGFYLPISEQVSWLVLLLLFVILLVFAWITYHHPTRKVTFGFIVCIFVFVLGYNLVMFQDDRKTERHYTHFISAESNEFRIVLEEKLKSNTNYYRFVADLKSVGDSPTFGKVLVHVKKDSFPEPAIGSVYLYYGLLQTQSTPQNPSLFDYNRYLEQQQIYGRLYLNEDNSRFVTHENTLQSKIASIRNRILYNLKRSGFAPRELSVFHALLLGQQQDISPEIIQAYQYAGAIHILSVSGLHVAYIYLFIQFVLQFLPNHKKGRLIKLVLLMLSLWGFALLAGLSPAIVRAVTMFSFIAFGKFLGRHTSTMYALVASMVFILAVNTRFIFDVGFQLSYLALFFILWLKPVLDQLYQPQNKVSKYIWDVATVSLSAQIGVLPLSLYYFHQFPTLFILTNLMVLLPLSAIMIYGIIVSVLAGMGLVHPYLSKVLELGIWYLNEVSVRIAGLEDFVLKNIRFTAYELVLWYLIIIGFFLWLQHRKATYFYGCCTGIVLLQCFWVYQLQDSSSDWIVFQQYRSSVLAHRQEDRVEFYSSDSLSIEDYLIKNYLIGNQIRHVVFSPLKNVYTYKDTRILVIDQPLELPPELRVDVVVLVNSPKINLERLLRRLQPRLVIADGSNYKSFVMRWQQTCNRLTIPIHSTYSQGYYSFNK